MGKQSACVLRISNFGRVQNLAGAKYFPSAIGGYRRVSIGKQRNKFVHTLVNVLFNDQP
jgi:hypothetical protein